MKLANLKNHTFLDSLVSFFTWENPYQDALEAINKKKSASALRSDFNAIKCDYRNAINKFHSGLGVSKDIMEFDTKEYKRVIQILRKTRELEN